ncbi:hypothetical protein IX306_000020 [Porphyromonas levii]|uniref:hypothetical protein n=1 Tax=Porphyromonas levii TaxID=28114 RepID=UPI001BADFBB1|nr:hypothetical protein [Porphyromonas levii]MBR8765558.1 hypothetical protein [Porphyromonas levii]MBR8772920.1 hypothetical protein [Porphyromonas levii]
MKKITKATLSVVALTAIITSCGSITNKLSKKEQENNRLGLSFVNQKEIPQDKIPENLYDQNSATTFMAELDSGKMVTVVTSTKDEETGEYMPSMDLPQVTIIQKIKNIVERNGKVNLDFIITVPKTLIDDRWQLRVYPNAFKDNDEVVNLEPLVLSGADFLRMQEKGYQQYKAFLASIVPDSLYWKEMIDQKGVAKALSDLEMEYHNAWQRDLLFRNEWIDWRDRINKRYMIFNRKMKRNRMSIDPETSLLAMFPAYWLYRDHTKQSVPRSFAEYAWGNDEIIKKHVSPEDSLEIERKYTNIKRIAENERKKQEKEAMYNKLVKFPRIQARLDSIVQGKEDFKYYYSQEFVADSGTKKIKLVLDGEVIAIDLSTYKVPSSDTLTYNVSAMVDLLDESTHYKLETIYRQVDKEVSADIEFEVASAVVQPELRNNEEELAKIKDVIFDIEDGGSLVLDSLTMVGYASPEGGFKYNEQLANRRTEALRQYLLANNYFGGRRLPVRTANGGENWDGVQAWVADTAQHGYNPIRIADIMNLLSKYRNEDEREQALRMQMPEVYNKMKEELYPSLRKTVFRFYTHRAEMQEEKIETQVVDERYNEGRDYLRNRDYKEALNILKDYPDDYNYAISLMSLGYDKAALNILKNYKGGYDNANVQYLLAILHVRLGDIKAGLAALNRSAELETKKIYRAQMDPELNLLIEKYNLFSEYLSF